MTRPIDDLLREARQAVYIYDESHPDCTELCDYIRQLADALDYVHHHNLKWMKENAKLRRVVEAARAAKPIIVRAVDEWPSLGAESMNKWLALKDALAALDGEPPCAP